MSKLYLLPRSDNWYKANLHCHSVLSDGNLTVEELKALYMSRGYSIIAFTDHRVYHNHAHLNDSDFVAIAATEINVDEDKAYDEGYGVQKTYHINLFDTNPEQFTQLKQKSIVHDLAYEDKSGLNDYIKKMNDLGFLVCYNHPYWSLQDYRDYCDLEGLWGMEIFNFGCEHDGLYGYAPQAYADMLREGRHLYCVSTDDNHNWHKPDEVFCDSFGGFTMINAPALDYSTVINALRDGCFYSSMGPAFKGLWIEEGVLHVHASEVEKIFVHCNGRICHSAGSKKGETISQASFTLSGKEKYIQVQIRDARGLYADTNAYFLADYGYGANGI